MALRVKTDRRLTCLKSGDKQTLVRSAIDAIDPTRTSGPSGARSEPR